MRRNVEKLDAYSVKRLTRLGMHKDDAEAGLYFRIGTSGRKSWVLKAKDGITNKAKTVTLGVYPSMTLDDARKEAKKEKVKLGQGSNATDERRAKKAAIEAAQAEAKARDAWTLEKAFALFMDVKAKQYAASTVKNYSYVIKKHLRDWLGNPMHSITEDDILELNGELTPSVAHLTMRALGSLFRFCIKHPATKHAVTKNPVLIIAENGEWQKVPPRDRIITSEQMPIWTQAVVQLPHPVTGDFLIFLRLTGLRSNTAARLVWGDVIARDGRLNVRKEIDKTSKDWCLPLGEYTLALLEKRRQRIAHEPNDAIFPGVEKKFFHCMRSTYQRVVATTGIDFTPHDLRRNFNTTARMECPEAIAKKLMNHSAGKDVNFNHYFKPEWLQLRKEMQKVEDALLKEMGLKEPAPPVVLKLHNRQFVCSRKIGPFKPA